VNTRVKRWLIKEQNQTLSKEFSQSLSISPLVSQLLINRGITTVEQADYFLTATLKNLHSPLLMKNMDKAVARVVSAIKNREKICIYGDYDVDGITATAILVLFLREIQADVFYYLPHRLEEGYGLDTAALKKIRHTGAHLLITVDCGISDSEPIRYAQSQNLDVLVTDHHQPPEALPPAYAILNPKQPGCTFPFKELAGVGVAFNLLMALRRELRHQGFWGQGTPPNLKQYLDLVALGTIADIVPLIDENRLLVKYGLEVLSKSERPGIRALKAVSATPDGPVTGDAVAFRLAPRINASGRVSTATTGVELLTTSDPVEAQRLARILNEENSRRQQLEKTITAEAKAMINGEQDLCKPLVFASSHWHQGVIGICASRLVEEFYRPTILISIDDAAGTGRGSARSIHGFDLYNALKRCADLLTSFGGHRYAAGLTIPVANIPAFEKQLAALVREVLREEDFIPHLEIDAQLPLSALSDDLIEEIEKLAPFGTANPEPLFCSQDLTLYSFMVVGNGHLKLKIKEDGCFYDAIGFNMGSSYNLTDQGIRLAFVPQFNLWQGAKNIQLKLKDIQHSSCMTP
jgi:single-stranded-DNA-specific exonuclease